MRRRKIRRPWTRFGYEAELPDNELDYARFQDARFGCLGEAAVLTATPSFPEADYQQFLNAEFRAAATSSARFAANSTMNLSRYSRRGMPTLNFDRVQVTFVKVSFVKNHSRAVHNSSHSVSLSYLLPTT